MSFATALLRAGFFASLSLALSAASAPERMDRSAVRWDEKIEVAARRGQVALLIHAADAAEDGRRKLDQALRVGTGDSGPRQGVVFPEGRAILSLALGRDNVVHVAIVDRAAAARVSHAVERWRAFIGPEAGLGTAPAEAASASEANVSEGI